MPVHTEFIRRFLTKWEKRQTVAYIPCERRNFTGHNRVEDCGEVIGASGVTVGTGLDLGQQAESDLRRMGIPDALIERFRSYLGKRRDEAVGALVRAPLTLTDAECDTLDAAVHGDYIRRAAKRYDRHASGDRFADLPQEPQAVIVSLFYQLGSPAGYPQTWRLLCAGNWEGAAEELRTGFSHYIARRRDEADLLGRV